MDRLTGHDAIDYAEAHSLTLSKHADPTEEARQGLAVAEAREIATEDPSLIYVDVVYGIKISTANGPYRWIYGWDATYASLAEAEDARARAERHDGWSARIVVLDRED